MSGNRQADHKIVRSFYVLNFADAERVLVIGSKEQYFKGSVLTQLE